MKNLEDIHISVDIHTLTKDDITTGRERRYATMFVIWRKNGVTHSRGFNITPEQLVRAAAIQKSLLS